MNGLWAGMMLAAVVYGAILRNIAGYHAGSAGFGQRSGDIKYDHVGNSGFLDGTDADRDGIRPGGTVDERCGTIAPETVSTDSCRSSCHGADRPELHCQYAGTWLGCHSGGNEGNGGIVETGEDSQRTGAGVRPGLPVMRCVHFWY